MKETGKSVKKRKKDSDLKENVIYNDHNAQSHDSEVWINSRKERKGNE